MMKVKLCKVYTLECQQGDEICFRYNQIHYFDTLERQTMGVNKYATELSETQNYTYWYARFFPGTHDFR